MHVQKKSHVDMQKISCQHAAPFPDVAPHSVVLADGAPAVLARAPLSVVLADGGAPAVLAFAPASVVLTDGSASAVLAFAPDTLLPHTTNQIIRTSVTRNLRP